MKLRWKPELLGWSQYQRGNEKKKYYAGHVAATHDENLAGGGILHLTGGFFFKYRYRKLLILGLHQILHIKETEILTLV